MDAEYRFTRIERELNRVMRKVDKLFSGGMLHVRERVTWFEHDVNIGGVVTFVGDLLLGGNLLFTSSDIYIGFQDDIDNTYLNWWQSGGWQYMTFMDIDLEWNAEYIDLYGDIYLEEVEVGNDLWVRNRLLVSGHSDLQYMAGVERYLVAGPINTSWQQRVTNPSIFDAIGDVRIWDDTNLGAELHTHSNAASISSEADATTGWTASGGTFTSDDTKASGGSYSLKLAASSSNHYIEYAFTAVIGTMYRVSFKGSTIADHGVGWRQRIHTWTNLSTVHAIMEEGTGWWTYTFYVTATGTAAKIRIYASYAGYTSGDLINVDSVSIKEVLVGGGDLSIGGTLTLNTSGTAVSEFSTDDTLGGDSDTAVPTEQAVKKYVDDHANGLITTAHTHAKLVASDGSPDPALSVDADGVVTTQGVIRGATSLWYRATHISAMEASPGGSGATLVVPDANTLGGYQLNAAAEKLYFNDSITSVWDGASDLHFRVTFEVNVDNTAGGSGDTVDLQLICYYKGDAETANKTQTLEEAKTVGQSAQYKRFTTVFTIDWDATDNIVEVGDKMSFILNLETDTSEVDDIIVNTVMFRYKKAKLDIEV